MCEFLADTSYATGEPHDEWCSSLARAQFVGRWDIETCAPVKTDVESLLPLAGDTPGAGVR
jgi:hypothetical protein